MIADAYRWLRAGPRLTDPAPKLVQTSASGASTGVVTSSKRRSKSRSATSSEDTSARCCMVGRAWSITAKASRMMSGVTVSVTSTTLSNPPDKPRAVAAVALPPLGVEAQVTDLMNNAFKMDVPLEVNVASGPTWADAKG